MTSLCLHSKQSSGWTSIHRQCERMQTAHSNLMHDPHDLPLFWTAGLPSGFDHLCALLGSIQVTMADVRIDATRFDLAEDAVWGAQYSRHRARRYQGPHYAARHWLPGRFGRHQPCTSSGVPPWILKTPSRAWTSWTTSRRASSYRAEYDECLVACGHGQASSLPAAS